MQCPRCASERFDVIWTQRNRNRNSKHANDCDLRRVVCRGCQQVYETETVLVTALVYNEHRLKSEKKPIDEFEEKIHR